MARLQDFQTVTPTDSDNILIVQATNQGLATVGSTLGAKMDKANPSGTGKLSINRASGSTEGANSVAVGTGTTASANSSFAEGYLTTASGYYSHAEGYLTTASGTESHSEGDATTASGDYSHSEGMGTIAQRKSQHVFGEYNLADTGGTGVTAKGTAPCLQTTHPRVLRSGDPSAAGPVLIVLNPVFKHYFHLFIWLHQTFVAARGIF